MTKPLVSVFLPYYNDTDFLKQSIDCVINQTYANWELILVNHGSTDGSKKIAHSYKDSRIKHIEFEENLNPGAGLLFHYALKQATGKYIKFFCADDVMLDNCLEVMVNYMQNNPQVDFCFANMQYIDETGKYYPDTWFGQRPNFNINYTSKEILKCFFNLRAILPYPSSMAKREKLNFEIDKISAMIYDCSLWINMLINGNKHGFIDKVLVLYRIHKGQVSYYGNIDKSYKIGMLEEILYFDLFFKITSIGTIKYLLDKSPYVQKLNDGDEKFIPFVLSHYFAYYGVSPQAQYLGRLRLERVMDDDVMRGLIKDTFGYTLKDFRDSLVDDPVMLVSPSKIYNICFNKKTMPILKIVDLIRHRIHHGLRKMLGMKKNHKKPYSL
jgi:glycosyltransferase involved in cell wall biosynthesis